MRILIIEDENRLAATLADVLLGGGYESDISYDGIDGQARAESGIYDAVILDVMLPGRNGWELLSCLRKKQVEIPVLMLTARSELADRIRGLDAGADYYLTKPFENEELLACLRTILRKSTGLFPDSLSFEDISLEPALSQLRCNSRDVTLSAKEMELMRLLIQNSSQYLPKETLLLKIWGYDSNANSVEVYISFLRKKLTWLESSVRITVLRNIGYRLEAAK